MPIPFNTKLIFECKYCHFRFKIKGDHLSLPSKYPKCGACDWTLKG